MKSFFVICFLAIFADGADEKTKELAEASKKFAIGININMGGSKKKDGKLSTTEKEPTPYSFPYQVGLLFETTNGDVWCGGSLISTYYILTASGCAYKMEELTAYLGVHNLTEPIDAELKIKVPKNNFIPHKEWDGKTSKDIVALIRLPSAVRLSKKVQLVNLPRRSQTKSNLVGKVVTVSGWGSLNNDFKSNSSVLHSVKLKVMCGKKCKLYFPNYVPLNNICTEGSDGQSNCVGDSGGPLVLEESDGSRTIVGLTAFGTVDGCKNGSPAVFTRITAAYLDFISIYTGLPVRN